MQTSHYVKRSFQTAKPVAGRFSPAQRPLVQHPGPGAVMYGARTDIYRIAVTRGADTLRVIERALPAEDVTDEEWASATEKFETFLTETPGADCEPRRPTRPALGAEDHDGERVVGWGRKLARPRCGIRSFRSVWS